MGDDVSFAIRRPAAVPATLTLSHLPHRAQPRVLVERRLYVVVEVEEHRRRTRRTGGVTAHRLAAVGGLVGPYVLQPDSREQVDGQIDHPVAVLGWGSARVVHGLVSDHPGEVLFGLGHELLHPLA